MVPDHALVRDPTRNHRLHFNPTRVVGSRGARSVTGGSTNAGERSAGRPARTGWLSLLDRRGSLDLVRSDSAATSFCRWKAVDNGVRKSRQAVENMWEVEMSPVVTVTRSELEGRRRALLDELGLSLEDFEALAETRTLTGHEFDVKEELDEIAFLLGE